MNVWLKNISCVFSEHMHSAWFCSYFTYCLMFKDSIDPPSDLKAVELPADFGQGTFQIDFEKSTDNVVSYVISCSKNSCGQVIIASNQSSAIMKVSATVGNKCHLVEVLAVDFCGRLSPKVTTEVCVNTIEGELVVDQRDQFWLCNTETFLAHLVVKLPVHPCTYVQRHQFNCSLVRIHTDDTSRCQNKVPGTFAWRLRACRLK